MSGERVQEFNSGISLEDWLAENTTLPATNRRSLASLQKYLLAQINTDRKTTIGISGAPGSGKSTLARVLVHYANGMGIPACLVSLDDYYLGRMQREELATKAHPLFRQRGVPGTHELELLVSDIDRIGNGIGNGKSRGMRLPVFDKSTDDRVPEEHWRALENEPELIILEGWCLGAAPPAQSEFFHNPTTWERNNDPDGRWRDQVLSAWQKLYEALDCRVDQLWYIRVPEWNCVIDWRWQQERELTHRNLENRNEVENFLGSFERIIRHMQNTCTQWADQILDVNHDHDIGLAPHNGKNT